MLEDAMKTVFRGLSGMHRGSEPNRCKKADLNRQIVCSLSCLQYGKYDSWA